MFGPGKTYNRANTHRPSMENGTQSHSVKFLNWGDPVNSVPDLADSPPAYITILEVNSLDPLWDLRLGSALYQKMITKPNLSIYFLGYQLSMSSKEDD